MLLEYCLMVLDEEDGEGFSVACGLLRRSED